MHWFLIAVVSILAAEAQAPPGTAAQEESSLPRVAVRRVLTAGQYMGLSGSSVSPDGRYLTFTDWTTGDLAVHDLVTGENRRVTNKGPLSKVMEFAESFMQFSRDGKQLAYIWDRNGYELRVINLDGSASRLIYRNEKWEVRAFDWSADGKYIAAVVPKASGTGMNQIALIRVIDGSVQGLKDLSGPSPGGLRMGFSPDGRFLAYDLPVNGESANRDISMLHMDGSQETAAVAHPANDRLLGWTPDGTALLFASDRAGSTGAWLQPFQDGKPQGVARLVRDNIGEGIRPLGFTRDGAYYYAISDAVRREVYTAALDLEKGIVTDLPARAPQVPGSNEGAEWSPDGKSLAYIHNDNSIVIRSFESGTERSLTPKAISGYGTVGSGERYLRWSPDGRQLLAPQRGTLFLINATTGEATPTVTDNRSRYGRWSPDGKAIFYARQLGLLNDTPGQIVRLNLETQEKEVLYTSELRGENFTSLELSPDGWWLAFSGAVLEKTSGEEETVLMVVPAEGGQPRLLLQVPGAEQVKAVGWTPDAREILFARDLKLADEPSTTLWRIAVEGGEPRKIELGRNVLNDIRFHPDGRRVAFDSGQRGIEIWVLENFLPAAEGTR
ncbi:MAG: PD40 domain-containing protein [Acidobacteria bacterium]|nr:PD40 domain-containing protein [Acidobacteriota bacterium]